jgi:hypothetical protein
MNSAGKMYCSLVNDAWGNGDGKINIKEHCFAMVQKICLPEKSDHLIGENFMDTKIVDSLI